MKKAIALILLVLLVSLTAAASALAASSQATPTQATPSQADQIISIANKNLGKPYKVHSHPPRSFNCFTFVKYCVNKVVPGKISSSGINGSYTIIKSRHALKRGDILFFKLTRKQKGIRGYHYGIYAGKGYFIHAAEGSEGVRKSKVRDYKKRFIGAVRVV